MTTPDKNEREIRELFSAARRADAEETPGFKETLRAAREVAVKSPASGTRRGLQWAFVGAAASAAVAGFAFWLVLQESPAPLTGSAPETNEPTVTADSPRLEIGVPDPTGMPIAGATVFLDHDNGQTAATRPRTGSDGVAVFTQVKADAGSKIEGSYPGMDSRTETDVAVPPGLVAQRPVRLGSEDKVVASGSVIDRKDTDNSLRFRDEFSGDLPLAGRDYQHVLTLAPGVHDNEGDGNVTVHGSRERDFKSSVDDLSSVDPLAGKIMAHVNSNPVEKSAAKTSGAGVNSTRAKAEPMAISAPTESPEARPSFNTEGYRATTENRFLSVQENPLSTFSIDVDTGSYSNVRRFLTSGTLPPRDAVRIEELLNYFSYDDPTPRGDAPFSARIEIADCPWAPDHRLARIGLKGRTIARGESRGSNLVFLIDVSGSMDTPDKLPLLKSALALLVDQLQGRDRVAMVVYAGASGLVLPSTAGSAKAEIRAALDRLRAGGGTNGAAGVALAYQVARENFIPGGVNRVILATDGDFNLGMTSESDLLGLIKKDADDGIFLTTLGFGTGNYQDHRLEMLADKGNGAYAYIDTIREARKVLVEQIEGTLVTIAKDVKVQIEFNPAQVGAYRLIGYENRMLAKEDFNDDKKDAGEIGAGHSVTALYELVPADVNSAALPAVDSLKYQEAPAPQENSRTSRETLTLKLRYKEPDGAKSRRLSFPVIDDERSFAGASTDFKFAAAVAGFGMLLRDSEHRGDLGFDDVHALALQGIGVDTGGYRAEFLSLVRQAASLQRPSELD